MRYVNYLCVFAFTLLSAVSFAQDLEEPAIIEESAIIPLPLGVESYDFVDKGLFFSFQAEEQGVLVVATKVFEDVNGNENAIDENIVITLHDEYGQQIEKVRGHYKGEHTAQGVLILPSAGSYTIGIQRNSVIANRFYGGQERVEQMEPLTTPMTAHIASSFVPTASFASFIVPDRDNDENPSKAIYLEPGYGKPGSIEVRTSVGGGADPWDWWSIKGEYNVVIVRVLTQQGDVILHVFDPNTSDPSILSAKGWAREDVVNEGREILVENPKNGEPVVFRVLPYLPDNSTVEINYVMRVEIY